MIAPPPPRDLDPVEAASRAAHETFRQATRRPGAQRRRTARAPRPFGSVSRGAKH